MQNCLHCSFKKLEKDQANRFVNRTVFSLCFLSNCEGGKVYYYTGCFNLSLISQLFYAD